MTKKIILSFTIFAHCFHYYFYHPMFKLHVLPNIDQPCTVRLPIWHTNLSSKLLPAIFMHTYAMRLGQCLYCCKGSSRLPVSSASPHSWWGWSSLEKCVWVRLLFPVTEIWYFSSNCVRLLHKYGASTVSLKICDEIAQGVFWVVIGDSKNFSVCKLLEKAVFWKQSNYH